MDWRESSYSGANGRSCVETAGNGGVILVRDSTSRAGFNRTGRWRGATDAEYAEMLAEMEADAWALMTDLRTARPEDLDSIEAIDPLGPGRREAL
jgi:hypothetical protein